MIPTVEIQHSISVLLIEDNPGDVDLIREMLADTSSVQFEIDWAVRLSTGLDMLAHRAFDVLLLDFSLPDSTGLNTLLRVRAEISEVPVVVLTGLSDEMRMGVKAVQAGAQDYLVKGQIDSHLLVRTLSYAIERKQIEKELDQYRNHLETMVAARSEELTRANESLQQEVTERKRIEDRLRQITDNMLDMIYQTDADGIIEYVSPSVYHILGSNPENVLGHTIYYWIHPDDVQTVKEAVQTVGKAEFRYQNADGHYLWLETLSSKLLDEDGTVKGIVFAGRDVTLRRKAEEELRELNQLKSEFLSTAAHELRTPLTSILGFSEILLTRDMDANRTRRYMGLINEQSVHLRKLVDALLDISRLESKGRMLLEMQPVSLMDLAQKVIIPFAELAPKHRFLMDSLAAFPIVNCDPFRIGQVLQNLVSNAVKYSPAGGSVTICGHSIPGFVQVSIQDEGLGMTAQQQKHLFERFYRADASNNTISGTGLGLAICKLIIDLHDGRIWIESQPNVGSIVHFTLPSEEVSSVA